MPINDLLNKTQGRRVFLKSSAMTALAGGLLTGCDTDRARDGVDPKKATGTDSDHSGGAMAPNPAPVPQANVAMDMDKMHEAGIKAFPAKTVGKGNQLLAPTMENGVKVYRLTASVGQWETSPGIKVEAWMYNGQLPGPQMVPTS